MCISHPSLIPSDDNTQHSRAKKTKRADMLISLSSELNHLVLLSAPANLVASLPSNPNHSAVSKGPREEEKRKSRM